LVEDVTETVTDRARLSIHLLSRSTYLLARSAASGTGLFLSGPGYAHGVHPL